MSTRGRNVRSINWTRLFKVVGIFSVAAYVAVVTIGLQMKITANLHKTHEYRQKTSAALSEKLKREEELKYVDEDWYVESKAREAGFVFPNERILKDPNKAK